MAEDIYNTFDKGLYRIGSATYGTDADPTPVTIEPSQVNSGGSVDQQNQYVGAIVAGKQGFTNAETGYILGIDKGVPKFYIGNTTSYINWNGVTLSIVGGLNVDHLDIPDTVTASSFHVAVNGDTWWGSTALGSAVAKVLATGAATFTNVSITGGSVSGTTTVGISNVNIAARGWTQTSIFSVTDSDTIAWGAGTFTSADGTAYSIGAGNTGNMAAATYIYLDIAVSTTAYQTTATAATAVGAGKVLIAKAQNNTTEATFQVFGGIGGQNIDASSIVANSITANELSTSILYAGSIVIDTAGLIRSGQTAFNTGIGWFIGNVAGTAKFSIGNPASYYMTWDGSNLSINGTVPDTQTFTANGTWTKPAGAKFVRVVCIGAGGGGGSGYCWAGVGGGSGAGSGGGGGAVTVQIFDASVLGATETITVGTGGTGGAAVSAGAPGFAAGLPGNDGGLSSFGTWIQAGGGGGGGGGFTTTSAGSGGGQLTSAATTTAGTPNVAASATAVNRISGQGTWSVGSGGANINENAEWGGATGGTKDIFGSSSIYGGPGGGGGGSAGAGTAAAGGTCGAYTSGGGGGGGTSGASPTVGTDGLSNAVLKKGYCGSGGGGGGGTSSTVNAKAGGAGGIPAAGGGGGGSYNNNTDNTKFSGAGGNGARGEVRIYTS